MNKWKEISNKIIKSKLTKNSHTFSFIDKKYIENNLELSLFDNDLEMLKLSYLIANVKNNFSDEKKENLRQTLNIINKDVLGYENNKSDPMNELYNAFRESTKFFGEVSLTPQQNMIYKASKEHNLIISAGTGFGKTFLFSNIIMEQYTSKKGKYLLLVPTELLELQITEKFKGVFPVGVVGPNIGKNDVIIATPEKIMDNYIKYKDDINMIVIDEAHTLFYKDDQRMIFLRYLINKMSVDCLKSNFHFLSPFLSKDNISEIKSMIERDIKYIRISPPKNKYQVYKDIGSRTIGLNGTVYSKAKYDKISKNGVTLHYMSSKDDVRKEAINSSKISQNIDRFKRDVNEWDKSKRESFKEIINNRLIKEYPGENIISNGVAYLHADVPTAVKLKIIELINNGMVNYLYATNSVLNGIDLPFDNIIIEKTKIGNKPMNPSDFKNLVGRAGRFSKTKRFSNFGFTIIKNNEINNNWWDKNRDKINKPDHSMLTQDKEEDLTLFVSQSLKEYEKTKNKKYLIDPRINPDDIGEIQEKYTSQEVGKIIFNLLTMTKKSKKELDNEILKVLKLYKFHSYKAQAVKDENEYKVHVLNGVRNYLLYNFGVDRYLKTTTKHSGFIDKDDISKSEYLEKQNFRVKTYGKYFFMMFLNHLTKASSFQVDLDDIFEYHVFNIEIIKKLNKKRNSSDDDIHRIWKEFFIDEVKWNVKRGLIKRFIGLSAREIREVLNNKRIKVVKESNQKDLLKIIEFLSGIEE